MNRHLDYVRKFRHVREGKFSPYDQLPHTALTAFLDITDVTVRLSYKVASKWVNVQHRLDCIKQPRNDQVDGGIAYCNLQKYAKIPSLKGKYGYCELEGRIYWDIISFGGIRYFKKKLNGTCHKNCWGYDLNSAYATACLKPVPDTRRCFYWSRIGKGQVGFDVDGKPRYKDDGTRHKYVFNLIKNDGLERWARINYKRRHEDRDKYKRILNLAIGQMQHHNPFVRNTIIDNSNEYIRSLIDKNTLSSNTDSIVSMVERKDLKLGNELGEWKLEHRGSFAYKGNNNQWNKEQPVYSGVPKGWFYKEWDLLRDPLPTIIMNYRIFNKKSWRIEDNDQKTQSKSAPVSL